MLPLMDKQLQEKIPQLYETDGKPNKMIYARYYLEDWEWLVFEYSPLQRLCFGLVDGYEKELGYFTLDELEEIGAIRDFNFEPTLYKEGDNYGKRTT